MSMPKDSVSSSQNIPIMNTMSFSGTEADAVVAAAAESLDDACSICLEPFTTHDPAAVTNCKHEYHLQCILEWSQRSKECPLCWQHLVLKDPASQELLAAVECERNSSSRQCANFIHENHEIDDARYLDDSHFDGNMLRHFAAVASRAQFINRRARQRSSQALPSSPAADEPSVQQNCSLLELCQNSGDGLLDFNSSTSRPRTSAIHQASLPSVTPNADDSRGFPVKPSQPSPDTSQRPSSSDLLAFSESFKSKLSATSARYKDSISRSTRGFKEKILSHNNSVKELSKGVQREMNAGFAGVTRMIERLDLTSKRTETSVSLFKSDGGSSNFFYKGKGIQENAGTQPHHGNAGETTDFSSSHEQPPYISDGVPGCLEKATFAQSEN